MFPNQNSKLSHSLRSFNNLMPITLNPTLNIVKLQLAFADDLKQLPSRHALQLPLCKRHGHGAHFAFNIQLFNRQKVRLKSDYFVAIGCPLDEFMDGGSFDSVKHVSLG